VDIKDIISSGLLELYVLGMASEQETAEVNAWAGQYPEVAAEIAAIESGLQHYAMAYAVQPGADVKEKIFAAIGNRETATDNRQSSIGKRETAMVKGIPAFWKYAAAAAIVLLTGSAVFNVVFYNKYNAVNKDYHAAVVAKNSAEEQLAALDESNKEMKNAMGVIQSKYSEPHTLAGQQDAPDAVAKIFWMKNTGDVYIDPSNLPDAPTGMQYQFWAFIDGKPVDGGLIVTSKKGDKYRIQKMKTFGKAEAFAVTLETEGGHPTPQGKLFVMGKM